MQILRCAQEIPCGNDRKKSKGKNNRRSLDFARDDKLRGER
jgi:hypothetical protein